MKRARVSQFARGEERKHAKRAQKIDVGGQTDASVDSRGLDPSPDDFLVQVDSRRTHESQRAFLLVPPEQMESFLVYALQAAGARVGEFDAGAGERPASIYSEENADIANGASFLRIGDWSA
jgi:hypothetical protein